MVSKAQLKEEAAANAAYKKKLIASKAPVTTTATAQPVSLPATTNISKPIPITTPPKGTTLHTSATGSNPPNTKHPLLEAKQAEMKSSWTMPMIAVGAVLFLLSGRN